MKKYLNLFIKAILAGVYIAIAGAVYLFVSSKLSSPIGSIIGGFLFSIGLLVIVVKDYYLYTGKVGYLFPYEKGKSFDVVGITLLGNALGILIIGLLLNIAKIPGLYDAANNAVSIKFSNPWYVTLVLSFFCGIMMYTAVDGYNKMKDNIARVVVVFLCVIIFLVLGFDHSIANIAYLIYAKQFSLEIFGLLVLMVIGNGLGSIFINSLHSAADKSK